MLTVNHTGLILARTEASGDFGTHWLFPTPFSRNNMLSCGDQRESSRLPMDIDIYVTPQRRLHRRPWEWTWKNSSFTSLDLARDSQDAFVRITDLLSLKSSIFVKGTKVSELDLLFGNPIKLPTPASFGIILGRLLEVSTWERNIRAFDTNLGELSTKALLKASLDTFRPIAALRQNVSDLRFALQKASDRVGKADTTAFDELQYITSHRLESLDSVFKALLERTDALSAKVSNEIQLVIGSVTIQVCT